MWFRTMGLVSLALLVGSCTSRGCGVDESEFACGGGLTRPYSVDTLLRVGQEHGVSLKPDPGCGAGTDDVAMASNIVIGDDVQDDDEVNAREGHVICDISDQPLAAPPFKVHRTKYHDDQETHVRVANIGCAIYPSADGQIARLERALRAVAEAPV